MVTLKKLLGARSEVHFECMYTKNKTQKRKVWHDGFVSLSASRKLVLFEDMPPDGSFCLDNGRMLHLGIAVLIVAATRAASNLRLCAYAAGKVIDEAKMTPYDWDRRDEEFIDVPKFLVEIINETPISVQGGGGGATSYSSYAEPAKAESIVTEDDLPPPRSMNSKFKVPVSSGSGGPPPRLATRPGGSRQPPLGRNGNAKPLHTVNKNIFDFDRNPTSEWNYQPNAINRGASTLTDPTFKLTDESESLAQQHAHARTCAQSSDDVCSAERRSRLALGERDRLPRVLGVHERLRVEHVVVLLDLAVSAAAPVDPVQLVEHDEEQHDDDPREHVQHHLGCVRDWEAADARGQRERAKC